jgi:hypothetical protein
MILLDETSMRDAVATSIIAGVFAIVSAVLTQMVPKLPKKIFRIVMYFSVSVLLMGLVWVFWPRSSAVKIEITEMPHFDTADRFKMKTISGNVRGVKALGELSVLVYAKGGQLWYIQPDPDNPKIGIAEDGTWKTDTRYGSCYSALVVKQSYIPSPNPEALPNLGKDVLGVTQRER